MGVLRDRNCEILWVARQRVGGESASLPEHCSRIARGVPISDRVLVSKGVSVERDTASGECYFAACKNIAKATEVTIAAAIVEYQRDRSRCCSIRLRSLLSNTDANKSMR